MGRILIYMAVMVCMMAVIPLSRGEEYSPQIIKVYDESEVEELEKSGVEILRRRGDILLCLVPDEDGNDVTISNSSRKLPKKVVDKRGFRRGDFNVPVLDKAVTYFDANDVLSGTGFDQPYTGKGVVVGICDIGFDPLHPTFLDANGKSRVRRLTQYVEREGKRIVLDGDDAYREWKTDNPDEYHATHVCGILAGGGAGSPYKGVARDADIVVSTSTLSDVGLLAGVEDIIDYAKEVGKPAVINLSMGNHLGAHDGSGLFSQYLDMCAENAVIVLSAGNQGNSTITIHHEFTESKPAVAFRLGNSRTWTQTEMYGATDIWSGSAQPVSIRISVYDDENYEEVYSYPEVTLFDYDTQTIEWNPENPDFPGLPFDGYLTMTGGVDPENGRYEAALLYDFKSPLLLDKGWAKYVVKVEVTGMPGNDVDVFADGSYTRFMSIGGYPTATSAMSISDLACGFNVVSVGMYGNRSAWTVSESQEDGSVVEKSEDTGFAEGGTVVYSSYGTLRDGRLLPLTVAPGATLVSSFNREYASAHPEEPHYLHAGIPWISESGTSMASPYVAGFIATWLEAFPSLTSSEVKGIIATTNRHDIDDPTNPRNVNGWFDPRSALLAAINMNGVESVDGEIGIFRPDETVEIFSADGMRVYYGKFSDILQMRSNLTVAFLPEVNLPKGMFVVAGGAGKRVKILK